jgi:hypothetical protein
MSFLGVPDMNKECNQTTVRHLSSYDNQGWTLFTHGFQMTDIIILHVSVFYLSFFEVWGTTYQQWVKVLDWHFLADHFFIFVPGVYMYGRRVLAYGGGYIAGISYRSWRLIIHYWLDAMVTQLLERINSQLISNIFMLFISYEL